MYVTFTYVVYMCVCVYIALLLAGGNGLVVAGILS